MTYLIGIGILVIIIITALITFNLKAAAPENRRTDASNRLPDEAETKTDEPESLENKKTVQSKKLNDSSYRQALMEFQPSNNETNDSQKSRSEIKDNHYRNTLKSFSEKDKR